MLNAKTLFNMSQIEITEIDPATLIDINTVVVNDDLSHEEKILSYIKQVGNPYCFKSGDVAVRVRFNDDDNTLSDSLMRYFSRLKQN